MSRAGKIKKNPIASFQTMQSSFGSFLSENSPFFPAQEPRKIYEKQEDFCENRSYKKQKTTDVYYNAKDPLAEVYTHDTNLKKRLRKYAAKYPELCKQTDDDGQGGLRFEIDKSRISIRLTAPYTDDRRKAASELAKKRGIHKQ